MKITITVTTTTLTQAALVEQALQKLESEGITFAITTTGSGIRHVITHDLVSDVKAMLTEGKSYNTIARELNIGPTTVGRIATNTHKTPR